MEHRARDNIDHPVGGHDDDDIANAAAGALLLVKARQPAKINDAVLARLAVPVAHAAVR